MSRVGKLSVAVPSGVDVSVKDGFVVVKGKLGELKAPVSSRVKIVLEGQTIIVSPVDETKQARAMWGTMRNNLRNMVQGVVQGFSVRLEINGVGFRAASDGKILSLSLGFSHEVRYAIPPAITVQCEKPTLLVISGANKQKVGQVAGELMRLRKVEPYKGKGIYIEGSYIRRKEGKKK